MFVYEVENAAVHKSGVESVGYRVNNILIQSNLVRDQCVTPGPLQMSVRL